MQPHARFDILSKIATGDFATVFRAHDKELRRAVAIKQIHPQYLSDPRQLNRYWDEAQLLASLEHPNVLNIYDIDRTRGWLILELMMDTMRSRAGGSPLNLELVRMGLVCGLKALEFLHKQNIIHGDVKPSNLLIDSRNWIKLGDFGLAQRATDDQGSLFKGTTRYIAPERVDPEIFGPVGPHSDLYSLGFSMYELLCGDAFDSLFPGLNAFGADKQIAWMMWHAGADRKMPQISRVLKGVPDDLAMVIERLVAKDPKIRYRDAQEAIRDLKIGMGKSGIGLTETEKAEAEATAAAEAAKKRRKNLLVAAVVSIAASIFLLFLIPDAEPPKPVTRLQPIDGRLVQVVANIESDKSPDAESQRKKQLVGKLVVDTEKDKAHQTLMIRAFDQVYLNDERIDINSDQFNLSTFEKEDHVHTDVDSDKSTGRQVQIIHVTRPIQETGTIIDIQPKKNAFVFSPAGDEENAKSFLVRIPDDVTVEVNEKQIDAGNAPIINLMQPKDYATIRHNVFIDETNRPEGRVIAPETSIIITRNLVTDGTIQNIDTAQRTLDIKTLSGNIISIPLDKNCAIFLNGRSQVGDRRFSLSDLRYNDAVSVRHDTLASRISAERTSKSKGIVEKVIPSARKITISLEEKDTPRMTFSIPPSVALLFRGESIDLKELQPTDQVEITYDATDPANPIISELAAKRAPDRKRWAMVIAFADYNDKTLSPVPHLQRDAAQVMDAFVNRYRVPQDQTLLITNAVRAELKSKVANFLRRLRSDSELIVYYAGHAYVGTNGQPQLATKSFRLLNADESGLPLTWLITEIEKSGAKEKFLFLDTCHEGSGNDLKDQPSSEEMVMILEEDRTNPALKSLYVIASCRSGERGQRSIEGGLFPAAISNAYRGNADKSKDQQITLDEANVFIRDLVSKKSKGSQNTALIKPGKIRPPRLSAAVIDTMQSLAKKLKQTRVSSDEFAKEINSLRSAGGGEPEPTILMGLAAMRVQRWNAAKRLFQEVPDQMIAQQGIIWSYFQQRDYRDAINTLITLIESAGREITENKNIVEASRALEWAGRLREYAAAATTEKDRITDINAEKIDDAARIAGVEANRFYNNGRRYVADKVENFDDAITDASVKSAKINIRNKKIKLSNYASFNLPLAISQTLRMIEGINQN